MLDIFLKICREDYFGDFHIDSKWKLVHKICKCILIIKREYNTPRKSRMLDTPDELYAKFISVVAGLHNDASLWYVTLCLHTFQG